MDKIIIDRDYGRKDVFEIVEKIPEGYRIWQIPPIRGYENYLALCIEYAGTCSVQMDKLKAIRVDDEKDRAFIKKFAMRTGCGNYAETVRYMQRRNVTEEHKKAAGHALAIFHHLTF